MDGASFAKIKLATQRVITAAEKAGVDISKIMGEALKGLPVTGEDIKEQMTRFNEDVGDNMFAKVIAGASALAIIDRWSSERRLSNTMAIQRAIVAALAEKGVKIEPSDVTALLMAASSGG